MSELRVALFDLDGTLCNSDYLHFEAWRDTILTHELTHAEYNSKISGRPNALIAADYFPALSISDREAVCHQKEARFRALAVGEHFLCPLAGLLDLIDDLRRQNFLIACVTNAPRLNAEFMLKQLGLSWRCSDSGIEIDVDTGIHRHSHSHSHSHSFSFDCLVIGEECSASKPSPVPYQEAMRRLGQDHGVQVIPRACVVFEDSNSGITSGRAAQAGLVVALSTTHSEAALKKMGAHAVAADYSSLNVDTLRALHARVAEA
jgi:beta-phosphoglucomutase